MDHCRDLQCEHGGYPNPNNCEHCLCPDGFGGRRCEVVQYSKCGALIKVSVTKLYRCYEFKKLHFSDKFPILKVSTTPVTISSPNYPEYYSPGEQCIWLLQAPNAGIVFLQFINNFQMHCEDTCDKSYVEIKTSADFRVTGYRYGMFITTSPSISGSLVKSSYYILHNIVYKLMRTKVFSTI